MFEEIKKAHFIGIGGVGVSALAKMMLYLKKEVSGSDASLNNNIEALKKSGAKIRIGHDAKNISKNIDIVFYSPAIKPDNPEIKRARELNIPVYSYPEAIGMISKRRFTIAISGAHGKTTTTSMLADVLIKTKRKPIVIVGGIIKSQKSNFVFGLGDYFVVEACEYKESFLELNPEILVITNIDAEHLDYYKNLLGVQKAFAKMINRVPSDGFIVCNPNDNKTATAIKMASKINRRIPKIIDYTKEKINFNLKTAGKHNISNAKAVKSVLKILKIEEKEADKYLKNFSGVGRRFDYRGKTKSGALVYDDYSHHPTEISALLSGAREKYSPASVKTPTRQSKIIAVFQPHLYSRTKIFLNDFANILKTADEIIITDIYSAREKDDKSIHAKDLVKKLKTENTNTQYIKKFADIEKYLNKTTTKNNIILTIGAGDIYKVAEGLVEK